METMENKYIIFILQIVQTFMTVIFLFLDESGEAFSFPLSANVAIKLKESEQSGRKN